LSTTTSPALNIIFAGTPDFAAQHLAALIHSKHHLVAVYCPPDKPAGRGKKLTACATKTLAQQHNIPVLQPDNFKALATQQQLANFNADIMVVVAYGMLLPQVILSTPKLGCINVHGSLLPKWRGAAPIQRALEAGDSETGVTIMQMDKGLDTGAMLLTARCPITIADTSATLYEKLAILGPIALLDALSKLANNTIVAEPQMAAQASYAAKLNKAEAELDWSLPAATLQRKVRAYIPWPVAYYQVYTKDNNCHIIKVWQASVVDMSSNQPAGTIIAVEKNGITVATAHQALRLELLQLPGKKMLPASDVLNGRSDWFNINQHITGKQ